MRSAVIKERRSISLSHSSSAIFIGFSFGAMLRGFGGTFVDAFPRAFLFGVMATERVFSGWRLDGRWSGGRGK
jgi:hypothetical protein